MYNFKIYKESCFNGFNPIFLEKFTSKNIKKGLQKTVKKMQEYINNGTVNDYTSFAKGYLFVKNNIYSIFTEGYGSNQKIKLCKENPF